ncbi:unnamed protein product [Owenia fusiformis]|uniref:RNA exonuclease 4 n=1 Tax=Owenia fusiformis TaxID=6347 RepID=A0A8S4PTD7_OWEFU|nr:unnamed protein product [Owenia fusiformis]
MEKNIVNLHKKHKSKKNIHKKTKRASKNVGEIQRQSRKPSEALKSKLEKKMTLKKELTFKKKRKLKSKEVGGHPSPANLIKNPEQCSSNWKKMMQTMEKEKPKTPKVIKRHQHKASNVRDNPQKEKKEPTIWFDDVDDIYIDTLKTKEKATDDRKHANNNDPLVKQDSFKGNTKCVAMDCEMVGVGENGKDSVLARVSIVNQFGQCLYDEYVKSREPITDYRTHVSGITPECLEKGLPFEQVQKEVSAILEGRILVGHALHNDLQVLYLSHPRKKIRDTLKYKPFRKLFSGRNPSLKKLSEQVLNVKVQEGEHSSVQDAQAAMRLYTMYRQRWEKELKDHTFGKSKAKADISKSDIAT